MSNDACAQCGKPAILDATELAAVPAGTVVRAADGTIGCRFDAELGVVFGDDRPFPWHVLRAPAQLLWVPAAD